MFSKKGDYIMNYQSLKKIYYLNLSNFDKFESIVNKRMSNEATVNVGLKIHPFSHKLQERISEREYNVFYVPNVEMELLAQRIYSNSAVIASKLKELPVNGKDLLFTSTLIKELQSTNDIEGVDSSEKELSTTMHYLKEEKNSKSKRRFKGLITQYQNIDSNKYNKITCTEDFRGIWDRLVKEEIDKKDYPDGELFREKNVEIGTGNKVVHVGDYDEEQITADLDDLIKVMDNDNLPKLVKCFIGHFYYEYVHPFYDGNGRTGRFITSSYLAQFLDPLSAISFSSAIDANRKEYYDAFSDMEDKINYGEATLFIMTMMNLLISAQEKLLAEIIEDKVLLDETRGIIYEKGIKEVIPHKVMSALCQQYIFGNDLYHLTDNELIKRLKISRYKLNQATDYLEKRNCIVQVGKAPKSHQITENIKRDLENKESCTS